MKKYAWTLAEMVIALTIVIILSGICVGVYKPNTNKGRIYVYSAMRNLIRAHSVLIEKKGSINTQDMLGEDDWYCAQMADVFSLDSAAECSRSLANDAVNISFPNGVTIQGMATPWKKPYSTATYVFKNIVVDIDGPKGLNRIWADRFPLRVFAGVGKGAEGMVMPINCGNDVVYNYDTKALVSVPNDAKSPYCKHGFKADGAAVAKDYTLDDEIITYDVYKAASSQPGSKAVMLASSISPKEADCKAYGSSMGFFSVAECDSAKIQILRDCATITNCETCTTANTCPNKLDDSGKTDPAGCKDMLDTINPDSISCFAILHKPNSGASFVIQSLVGDIDEFDQ
ncbi:MAG: hypothetical protein IJ877_03855 [Candidatus Gastranaerophilales bacterium]|nr:hypothetical protein [Candidatus Gastranaerophilales bacterium]